MAVFATGQERERERERESEKGERDEKVTEAEGSTQKIRTFLQTDEKIS